MAGPRCALAAPLLSASASRRQTETKAKITVLHWRTHPEPVDGCDRCRWASVAVAPSVFSSRSGGAEAAATNAREARWQKDMPAYRRLRRDGVQPKGIDGCAEVEAKAEAVHEVEQMRLMTSKQRHDYAAVTEGAA